jgi:hypothetical protein
LEEERHQQERLELLLVAQAAEQQAARQRAAEQRAAQHRAAEQQASQPQALQQQAVQPHAVLGAQVAQLDCVLELPKPNDGNLPKPNDGNRIVTSELVQEIAKPPSVDPVAQLASSKVSAPFTSDRLLSLPVISQKFQVLAVNLRSRTDMLNAKKQVLQATVHAGLSYHAIAEQQKSRWKSVR